MFIKTFGNSCGEQAFPMVVEALDHAYMILVIQTLIKSKPFSNMPGI
jgi:hypothetical protein